MRPRVSIGLPVYNGERYLQLAIDSVLAQTLGDFELIISDNASTDGTESICRTNASRDRRIRYLRQPSNLGVTRNFNLLVDHATAPFFKWASADDLIAPDLLERCLPVIVADPTIVLAHSKTFFIDANGAPLTREDAGLHLVEEQPFERLRRLWDILGYCNAQYGVMRIDALRETHLFGSFVYSDVCFLAELVLYGKFFEIPEQLIFRRFHEGAASNLPAEQLLEHYGLQGKHVLFHWRHFSENIRSILRAPISLAQKARCLRLVARRMVWQRAALTQEFGVMLRHPMARSRPSPGPAPRSGQPGSDASR